MISTYVHVSAYKYNDIYLIFAHNDMKIGGEGGGGSIYEMKSRRFIKGHSKGFRLK